MTKRYYNPYNETVINMNKENDVRVASIAKVRYKEEE